MGSVSAARVRDGRHDRDDPVPIPVLGQRLSHRLPFRVVQSGGDPVIRQSDYGRAHPARHDIGHVVRGSDHVDAGQAASRHSPLHPDLHVVVAFVQGIGRIEHNPLSGLSDRSAAGLSVDPHRDNLRMLAIVLAIRQPDAKTRAIPIGRDLRLEDGRAGGHDLGVDVMGLAVDVACPDDDLVLLGDKPVCGDDETRFSLHAPAVEWLPIHEDNRLPVQREVHHEEEWTGPRRIRHRNLHPAFQ